MPDFSFEAVKRALGLSDVPPTKAELIAARGGGGKGRGALAREILGLRPEPTKLPAKGTDRRLEYDNLMRALQRSEATGGRQHRPGTKKLQRQVERVGQRQLRAQQERLIRARLATMSVEGSQTTLVGTITVGPEARARPRQMRDIPMTPRAWEQIQVAYDMGGDSAAEDEFTRELFSAYGIDYEGRIHTYSELEIR